MPGNKKIVLDTNFLLIPGQYKVDIFSELRKMADFNYSLFVMADTVKELEKIALEGKRADKLAAQVAIGLLKAKNIKILRAPSPQNGHADDAIVAIPAADT